MSELKVRFIDDTYAEYYNTGKHDLAQVYLKSEADKVISELKKKINEAQTELELWRDGSIISEAHQKELDGKRHSDYKRCVAMVENCCEKKENLYNRALRKYTKDEADYLIRKSDFWENWEHRWLKIAEKLKEAK